MLRVHVHLRRAVATASGQERHALSKNPSPIVQRSIWLGSLNPGKSSLNSIKNNHHHHHRPDLVLCKIQQRNYIFLPASFSDASKLLKNVFDNNQHSNKRLMVKLQNRWQDTLFTFQQRMDLLKSMQREQRKLARQRAQTARNSVMRRSARYSLFVKNIHGNVGKLSSIAISRGKRNLLSHYNAKKRVYARRKRARQLARKMNGSKTLMDTLNSKYSFGRNGWGWMGTKPIYDDTSIGNTTWKGITLTEPTQQSWFDSEGYPLTSRDPVTGRFVNPWLSESSNGENGLNKFLRWKVGGAWCRLLDAVGISSDSEMCQDAVKKSNSESGSECRLGKDSARTDVTESGISQASSYQSTPTSGVPGCAIHEKFYHTATSDSQMNLDTINLTWIGHSSTIVTFPGDFTILTDPHFSNYAGPVRRTAPPAFDIADLPEVVDCVLISHDHMDHLDYWSILQLIESNKVKFWIVPLGIKSWLMNQAGVCPEDIVELEWWEGVRLSKPSIGTYLNGNNTGVVLPEMEGLVRAFDKDSGKSDDEADVTCSSSEKNELVITCAPAQHWCSRTPFDRNRRLWCSFAIHAKPAQSESTAQTHSFYFAGDTGLPPEFPLHHQIGDRLGPFDLAAIPIGAYEPNWFMRESHCNPAEAVKIHQAVRSKKSVAVHFDTFDLADEPREEPPILLLSEVERINEEIVKMMSEVAAVAKDVGIAASTERSEAGSAQDGAMVGKRASSDKAKEQLIEMLPPLVDFAVIKQGQRINAD